MIESFIADTELEEVTTPLQTDTDNQPNGKLLPLNVFIFNQCNFATI